jgi:prevent-host-death family protein
MKLSESIEPISYVKANAAEVINKLNKGGEALVITQNGEAKAVLQGIKAYERTQDALALFQILTMGTEDIKRGRYQSMRKAAAEIRRRTKHLEKK